MTAVGYTTESIGVEGFSLVSMTIDIPAVSSKLFCFRGDPPTSNGCQDGRSTSVLCISTNAWYRRNPVKIEPLPLFSL